MSTSKKVVAAVLALLVLALGAAWAVRGAARDVVTQPIAFNHKVHVEEPVSLACTDCHKGAEEGPHATIPAVTTCVKLCHSDAQGQHPDEPKLREYKERGEPVPWVVANRMPGHVYFSHVAHVGWAKMDCRECHGEMKDRVEPVTVSQIGRLTMKRCMECHEEKGVSNDCLRCHK